MKIRLSDLRRIIKEEVQRTLAEGKESALVRIRSMLADENDLGKVFTKDDNQQYKYERDARLELGDADLPVEEFDPSYFGKDAKEKALRDAYDYAPEAAATPVFHHSKRY
jgi:hypothetical protein